MQPKGRTRQFVAVMLCFAYLAAATPAAAQAAGGEVIVSPPALPPKTGAVYYSTNAEKKVLMPVKILGEVLQPGVHYVPIDSTLFDVVSLAGGPSSRASVDDVQLYRAGVVQYLDLYSENANRFKIAQGDSVVVDNSMKSDLPLIFSGITAVVSILSLYLLSREKL